MIMLCRVTSNVKGRLMIGIKPSVGASSARRPALCDAALTDKLTTTPTVVTQKVNVVSRMPRR